MWLRMTAIFEKTFKEFIRDRSSLFWTIAWPALWVVLDCLIFTQGVPKPILPRVKASMTLQMMGFAVMLAGMANPII